MQAKTTIGLIRNGTTFSVCTLLSVTYGKGTTAYIGPDEHASLNTAVLVDSVHLLTGEVECQDDYSTIRETLSFQINELVYIAKDLEWVRAIALASRLTVGDKNTARIIQADDICDEFAISGDVSVLGALEPLMPDSRNVAEAHIKRLMFDAIKTQTRFSSPPSVTNELRVLRSLFAAQGYSIITGTNNHHTFAIASFNGIGDGPFPMYVVKSGSIAKVSNFEVENMQHVILRADIVNEAAIYWMVPALERIQELMGL